MAKDWWSKDSIADSSGDWWSKDAVAGDAPNPNKSSDYDFKNTAGGGRGNGGIQVISEVQRKSGRKDAAYEDQTQEEDSYDPVTGVKIGSFQTPVAGAKTNSEVDRINEVQRKADELSLFNSAPRERLIGMADSMVPQKPSKAKGPKNLSEDFDARVTELERQGYNTDNAIDKAAFDIGFNERQAKKFADERSNRANASAYDEQNSRAYVEKARLAAVEAELQALDDAAGKKAAEQMNPMVRGLLKGGVQSAGLTGAAAGYIGDASGIDGLKQWGLQFNQDSSRIANQLTLSKNASDIQSIDDFQTWLAENGGYVAYQAAETILSGGLGSLVGKKIGKEATLQAVAMASNNLRQTLGSVYADAVDESKATGKPLPSLLQIAAGAVGSAAIDTVADKIGLDAITAKGFKGNFASRVAKSTGMQLGVQGGTEAAQLIPEDLGAGKDPFREGAAKRFFDEGAVGALGGAGPGVIGGIKRQNVANFSDPNSPASQAGITPVTVPINPNPQAPAQNVSTPSAPTGMASGAATSGSDLQLTGVGDTGPIAPNGSGVADTSEATVADSGTGQSVSQNTTQPTATVNPIARTSDADLLSRIPEVDSTRFATQEEAVAHQQQTGVADQTEVVDTAEFGGAGFAVAPRGTKETVGELKRQQTAIESLSRAVGASGESGAQNIEVVGNNGITPTPAQSRARRVVEVVGRVAKQAFGIKTLAVTGINGYGVAHSGYAMVNADDIGAETSSTKSMAALAIGTIGHEATHTGLEKSKDPEDRKAFANLKIEIQQYLKDGVVDRQEADENTAAASAGAPAVSREYAENEVIANISGAMWMDPAFWARVHDIDNGSTMRRVAYRFMQAATKFINAAKGSDLDIHTLVTNQKAVREIVAQVWAQKAMRQGKMPMSRTQIGAMLDTPPTDAVNDAAFKRRGVIGEVAPFPSEKDGKSIDKMSEPKLVKNIERKITEDEWNDQDTSEKEQANRDVGRKVAQGIMDAMGLRGWDLTFSSGTYEGKTNPNFIIEAPDTATQAQIDEFAKLVGYVLDQKAMVTFDENNTTGDNLSGFVKVVLPSGMPESKVNALRAKIGEVAKSAGDDTLRDGALVFGNYRDENGKPFSGIEDDAFWSQIDKAVSEFEYDGGAAEVLPVERYASALIQPDSREGYLQGTRYESNLSGQEAGGEVLQRDGQRGNLAQLQKLAESATGRRQQWVDSSASGRERIERNRKLAAEDRARADSERSGTVEYGQAGPNSVSAVGHHFSKERRKTLSSAFYGQGLKGLESKRLNGQRDLQQRIYFYVDNGKGVTKEAGVGGAEHIVKLNNLYDTKADPLKIIKNTKGESALDRMNNWERTIMRAGFDGYIADTGANQNFAVLVGKHDIEMPSYKRRTKSVDDFVYDEDTTGDLGNFNLDANDDIDLDFTNGIEVGEATKDEFNAAMNDEADEQAANQAAFRAKMVAKARGANGPKSITKEKMEQHGIFPERAFDSTFGEPKETGFDQLSITRHSDYDPSTISKVSDDQYTISAGGYSWFSNGSLFTKNVAISLYKAHLVRDYIHASGYDLASAYKKGTILKIANAWMELGKAKNTFKFGKSSSTNFIQIAKDLDAFPGYAVSVSSTKIRDAVLHFTDKSTNKVFQAYTHSSPFADDDGFAINTMGLNGSNVGSAVYAVVGQWAKNNGEKFYCDGYISAVNTFRRTEQAFSFSVKTGDSTTLLPGGQNRVYGFNELASTKEEHMTNIARLAIANMRNVMEVLPDTTTTENGSHQAKYNPSTGQWLDENGEPTMIGLTRLSLNAETGVFTDSSGRDVTKGIQRWLADKKNRGTGIGESTLARAVMTNGIIMGKVDPDEINEFAKPIAYKRKKIDALSVENVENVAETQSSKEASSNSYDADRPYKNAPDNLLGYRKNKQQAGFGQQNYKHVEFVEVDFGGDSIVEAMTGLNKPHAIERAWRNWRSAESITPISREEAESKDPGIGKSVDEAMMRDSGDDVHFKRKQPVDRDIENWASGIFNGGRTSVQDVVLSDGVPHDAFTMGSVIAIGRDQPFVLTRGVVKHMADHAKDGITPAMVGMLPSALKNPRAIVFDAPGQFAALLPIDAENGQPILIAGTKDAIQGIRITRMASLYPVKNSASYMVGEIRKGNRVWLPLEEVSRLRDLLAGPNSPSNQQADSSQTQVPSASRGRNQAVKTFNVLSDAALVKKQSGDKDWAKATEQLIIKDDAEKQLRGVNFKRKQTDTPEFKKFFDDSKVVDENGDPLLVYHATDADFDVFDTTRRAIGGEGAYFSSYRPSERDSKRVIAAYLSLKSPKVITHRQSDDVLKAQFIEQGHDGVIILREDGRIKTAVAFYPTQIKSATGNNGNFDGTNPDIRYKRKGFPAAQGLPEETKGQQVQRVMQDKYNRVKLIQELIEDRGGKVGEEQDVYRAEERMHGRVHENLREFADEVVHPLIKKAVKLGVDLNELAAYAYAKHAQERNAHIQKTNQHVKTGSGMSDMEADNIIQLVQHSGDAAAFDELHNDLLTITATTRRLMLDEGLITQDQYDGLEAQYENYVPLRGFEDVDPDSGSVRPGLGRGFQTKGKETIAAMGRDSKAGDIIENIIRDYERITIRAERNAVGKTFLDLVTSNPDPKLWEVQPMTRATRKVNGLVEYVDVADKGDETISVKVAGEQVYIKINDPLLLRAMQNTFKAETSDAERFLTKTLGTYTSLLRNTITRYNPAFGVINAVRDSQMGAAGVFDELGAEGLRRYAMNYGPAGVSSWRTEWNTSDTQNNRMDKWMREMRFAGGTTGGVFMRDHETIAKELRDAMLQAGAKPDGVIEFARSTKLWAGATHVMHGLELIGSMSENTARLAAYATAREMGKTPAQAASIAKNLTVNFNRFGEQGQLINTAFLFFNASVQGSVRIAQMAKNPKMRAAAVGMASVGFALAMWGATGGGDDEDGQAYWDKIPDFEKERNIIIMLSPGSDTGAKVGKHGRYVKIPMAYGLNVFPVLGYQLADIARNMKDPARGVGVAKASINMLSAVAGSYNPAGGSFDPRDKTQLALAVSPTVVDAGIQLYSGVNGFGQKLGPEKSAFDQKPDSENVSAANHGRLEHRMARWLNDHTGGNQARSGGIDIEPGTIKNLEGIVGGGLGKFVGDVLNLGYLGAIDAPVKDKDIPVWKAFYGEYDSKAGMSKFYERSQKAKKEFEDMKGEFKLGIKREYSSEEKFLQGMGGYAENIGKAMGELKKWEVNVAESNKTEKEKEFTRREIQRKREALAEQYNKDWYARESKLKRAP